MNGTLLGTHTCFSRSAALRRSLTRSADLREAGGETWSRDSYEGCTPFPTAHCRLPAANCQLPTANCLLPTAYCLFPIPYSLTK